MYHKKGIGLEEIELNKHRDPCKCEALWLILTDKNGKKVVFALIYMSPDKPNQGVCLYHKKGIGLEEIELNKHGDPCKCGALWLILTDKNGKKVVFALIYRSPQYRTFLNHIERDLNQTSQLNLPIIIVGRLQLQPTHRNDTKELNEIFESQGMEQVITQPTRIAINSRTLIDHIWTSDKIIKDGLVTRS